MCLPFLVTRLPGKKQRWVSWLGQWNACSGSPWQCPGCPWLCPLPPPSHPWTCLGPCLLRHTPTPGSGGYSHHCRHAAAAAGVFDGDDDTAWDRAARVAEAAGHEEGVCGGRETAPVRPHSMAEALPRTPKEIAITCAVSPGDTPCKPPSPRLSPRTDHPLPALPVDTGATFIGDRALSQEGTTNHWVGPLPGSRWPRGAGWPEWL